MKNPFKGGERKFECNADPNSGSVVCESFRQNADGTKVQLASLTMQVDGMCNPVPSNMREEVEGELQLLEKKVAGRMVAKCQKSQISRKPADY